MVWHSFSVVGTTKLMILADMHDSMCYTDALKIFLLPFTEEKMNARWIYQQDNAAIDTLKYSTEWLCSRNIELLDWPGKIPDFNPIKNLWAVLTRRVYVGGRHFDTRNDIIRTIRKVRAEFSRNLLVSLVESLPRRLIEILEKSR